MPVWTFVPERTVALEEGFADGTTWVDAETVFALEKVGERKGRRIRWWRVEDAAG